MLLLAASFWGFSFPLQNMTASYMGTYTLCIFKNLGCILLVPIIIIGKHKVTKRAVLSGMLIGVTTVIGTIVQQMGIATTSVSNSSFLSSLYIIFVPLIGLFLKRKPKKRFWLAMAFAVAGIYFLCLSGGLSFNQGDIFILIGAFFWAIQIIFVDMFVKDSDPYVMTLFLQITALVISCFLTFTYEEVNFTNLGKIVPILIYYSTLSGVCAEGLQLRFQKDVEPNIASLILSLEAVFGCLGGWLILNQTMSARQLFGCALIFVAVILGE